MLPRTNDPHRERIKADLADAQAHVERLRDQEYSARLKRAQAIQAARDVEITWDEISHITGAHGRAAARKFWLDFLGHKGMPADAKGGK